MQTKKTISATTASAGRMSWMTHVDPDSVAATAAVDFARRLVPYWQTTLGIELIGVYLIGSLAHSGFSRRYSDVDVALVVEPGLSLSAQAIDGARSAAAALSADWGPKLSVFWTDRHFCLGRLPPLDRIDYLDHAFVLTERERVRPARPTLQEIQRYLSGEPFTNWSDSARRFAASETLEPKDHKSYLKTLLYPARFFYSWATGRIASNDAAAAFLSETRPALLDISLINRALRVPPSRRRSRLSVSRTKDTAVPSRCLCPAFRKLAGLLIGCQFRIRSTDGRIRAARYGAIGGPGRGEMPARQADDRSCQADY